MLYIYTSVTYMHAMYNFPLVLPPTTTVTTSSTTYVVLSHFWCNIGVTWLNDPLWRLFWRWSLLGVSSIDICLYISLYLVSHSLSHSLSATATLAWVYLPAWVRVSHHPPPTELLCAVCCVLCCAWCVTAVLWCVVTSILYVLCNGCMCIVVFCGWSLSS